MHILGGNFARWVYRMPRKRYRRKQLRPQSNGGTSDRWAVGWWRHANVERPSEFLDKPMGQFATSSHHYIDRFAACINPIYVGLSPGGKRRRYLDRNGRRGDWSATESRTARI